LVNPPEVSSNSPVTVLSFIIFLLRVLKVRNSSVGYFYDFHGVRQSWDLMGVVYIETSSWM
jgi:hypothetical protein